MKFDEIIFQPSWGLNWSGKNIEFVCGVIPQQLFYAKFKGEITDEISEFTLNCVANAFDSGMLDGADYVRVTDFSELKAIPVYDRKNFVRLLDEIACQHRAKLVAAYVCGAPSRIQLECKLMAGAIGWDCFFPSSVSEAFEWINHGPDACSTYNVDMPTVVHSEHVEEFNEEIGRLLFASDTNGNGYRKKVSTDNPLGFAVELLDHAQHDLRSSREKEAKIRRDLEVSNYENKVLLENMAIQVWYLSDPYTYGVANKAHADFLGADPEEIAFKRLHDILPKEVADIAVEQNKIVFETNDDIFSESWFPDGSGEKKYLSIHKTPICDENGNFIQVVCSAVDITDRKRAEEHLQETKDGYVQIFDSITEAIYVLDEYGTIIDANKGAENLYGYSHNELIGHSPTSLSAPGKNDLEKVGGYVKAAIESGAKNEFEFWGVRKNGEAFPKDVIMTGGVYRGQKVVITTARDISDRKKAEQAIHDQLEFRRLMMDLSFTFINIPLDETESAIHHALEKLCRFVDVDRSYIFEYDFARGMAQNTYEYCADGIEPQIDFLQELPLSDIPIFTKPHLKGEILEISSVFDLPKGSSDREVLEPQDIKSLVSVPMMIGSRCIGMVGFDSVRKFHRYTQDEIEMIKVFAQMQANVSERVAFQEKQKQMVEELKTAKEAAERSDQLKSAFLANMSHEIRTPLNGVLGFASLLDDPNLPYESLKEYADVIQSSGKHLLHVINDIIHVSKMEAGYIQMVPEPVFVHELLYSLYEVYREQLHKKEAQVELILDLTEEEIVCVSDPTRVRQIFENLLGNAIKFTVEGRIRFGCRIAAAGDTLIFFVEDTGIGISEEKLDIIFDRFVQASSETEKLYGGTGLGLSISKSCVELLGGSICVESTLGRGTSFRFEIPYEPVEEKNNTSDATDGPSSFDGEVILMAEDDEVSFRLVAQFFSQYSLTLIRAKNGREAVDIATSNRTIDLILMDINMPEMNGLDATREIRSFNPKIPIIAQTAFAFENDREKCLEAGCDDYISKPLELSALPNIVHQYLHRNVRS